MRLDWRGKPLRRDAMTLERALALADSMRATRRARGGKHGDPRYDTHRAMETLAKAVRQWRPRRLVVRDVTKALGRLDPSDGPLAAIMRRRR